MNRILVDKENRTNRLLININWFISFLMFFYLFIMRMQISHYISYAELFINAILAFILLVISEIWYLVFYKNEKLMAGLKYYLLTSIIIIFISVACVLQDPYILAIFYFPMVASALYYNKSLVTYTIIIEILAISCLLIGGFISRFYETSILRFCIEIAFAIIIVVLIIVRYSNTSKKVIASIKNQKEKFKVSNDKLIKANNQLNEQQQELIKINNTISIANEELEKAYKELRKSQTQLVYREKMASLGKLAAGVAHEINNPVGVINCNVDSFDKLVSGLKRVVPDNENTRTTEILSKLDTINQINFMACKRIIDIVKSIQNFTRMDKADYQNADIKEGLENTLILLKNRLKANIEIIKEYGEIPLIKCHVNQLNQVFLNLIMNAGDSIVGKGTIWIKTYVSEEKVFVSIRDNGAGIPKKYTDRIFESGFTTKEVGKGTGLGLAIVYDIMQKHNGSIEVNSKEGEGTEFILGLPLNQDYLEQMV